MNFNKRSKLNEPFSNYSATADGRIFNRNGHELKPCVNRYGYSMVKLSNKEHVKMQSVHRIIAETFIPNPNDKRCVNHIDGNKSNNSVSNLEWCTHSENMKHAYKHGLKKSYLTHEDRVAGAHISGAESSKRVLVKETGEVYSSIRECAEKTDCDPGAICKCCNGLANKHHGYHFYFADEV